MSIKVFISATRRDLGADLVKAAKEAVADAHGETVDMESWDTDFEPAVAVCEGKLEESTHYLGIFAYRRGWVPDELKAAATGLPHDQSITEYELRLADERTMSIAVFVPEHGSFIARQLEERAKSQTDEERREQLAFLERVQNSGRTLMPFERETMLYKKARRRALAWAGGGIRNARRRPARQRTDFSKLGRGDQRSGLLAALGKLEAGASYPPSAFVVHGPSGYGQDHVADALRHVLRSHLDEPREARVLVGAAWQEDGLATLVESIANQIGSEPEEDATVAWLAEEIRTSLDAGPLVLTVERVQRFGGGLPALIDEFWRPVAAALAARSLYPLVGLFTLESGATPGPPIVLPADEVVAVGFDPARPIALPRLAEFGEADLIRWFRSRGLSPANADLEAGAVFDETDGSPPQVFLQLMSHAN